MTADDEIKMIHNLNLLNTAYMDLSSVVWEVLGESSFALTRIIGQDALSEMENEFNLQVVDKPIDVLLKDIAKLLVEEFGFMKDIQVEMQGDKKIIIKVDHCMNRGLCDKLIASGVTKPFNCSIMGTCAAALDRSGYKMRNDIERWDEAEGSIITFTNARA